MSRSHQERIHDALALAATCTKEFADDPETARFIRDLSRAIADSIRASGKVLVCGNGGSACDASHFAEELTGRFRNDRPPIAAMACNDAAHITCTANDYGFEQVFSRWIDALATPSDTVVLLSTSGNSHNIIRALEAAKHKGATTALLLGRDGGKLRGGGDLELRTPQRAQHSDRIQELHMLALHCVVELVEHELFA